MPEPLEPPADLKTVLAAERAAIALARQGLGMSPEESRQAPLWGLALSGGGIRSATFNLGVLQALAQRRLLSRFDYLSTVSGGGYIGGWLTALCHRFGGIRAVEEELDGDPTRLAEETGDRDPVTWLRDYSNYLTPQKGLLSGDTWAAIATYLRNLLLNQTALVCFLALLLLLPRGLYALSLNLVEHPNLCFWGALGIAALALLFVARNLSVFDSLGTPRWNSNRHIQYLVTLPLLTAAWLLVCAFSGPRDFGHLPVSAWGGSTALLYSAVWGLAFLADLWRRRTATRVGRPGVRSWPAVLLSAPAAGFFGGACLGAIHHFLDSLRGSLFPGVQSLAVYSAERSAALWMAIGFGPPLVVLGATLMAVLHLGLSGRGLADWIREWWARLGGSLLIVSLLLWAPLFVLILFGPWVEARAESATPWLKTLLTSGWVLSTLGGILAGRSPKTGGVQGDRRLDWIARSAGYVFVTGFAILLSLALRVGLLRLAAALPGASTDLFDLAAKSRELWPHTVLLLSGSSSWPLLGLAAGGLATVLLVLVWRLDVNEFSMNPLYRNRVVRCYLGASNRQRRAERFTGFDPSDDLPLAALGPARPYPLLNAALNHMSGRRIAWRERKALPFVLSPLWCGYDIGLRGRLPEPGEPQSGYRPAALYASKPEELSLGTALAISGAAVNPCMGYHSSPAVTFLLTLFNARLGWWLPNPRVGSRWRESGPSWGLRYLLTELFGRTDFSRPHVHLSDGGHAENLGLYQLVKRGCSFIVVADASGDPDFTFGDLARALRLCRIDLGVEIEIDLSPLRPDPSTRQSAQAWQMGTIHYEAVDPGARPGVLLYLKAALTSGLPSDVASFARESPAFPHDSTANQWFTETQFESYRLLGQGVAAAALAAGLPQEPQASPRANSQRKQIQPVSRDDGPSKLAQARCHQITLNGNSIL